MQLEWLLYQWRVLSQPSWTVLEGQTLTFCCKWLTLSYFWYCKTLIVSVHLMPTHHRTELQTTQLSRYFAWIIEVGEGGKGEQSCVSWEAELMFSQQASHPVVHFSQSLPTLILSYGIFSSFTVLVSSLMTVFALPSPLPHQDTQAVWRGRVTQGKSE